jgi:hypothetical protein
LKIAIFDPFFPSRSKDDRAIFRRALGEFDMKKAALSSCPYH